MKKLKKKKNDFQSITVIFIHYDVEIAYNDIEKTINNWKFHPQCVLYSLDL